MRKLLHILRLPDGPNSQYQRAHTVWLCVGLTGLGCCIGVLSLMFAATAYIKLNPLAIFASYFLNPSILVLNLLPPILLIWLFYFLFRRAWAGFLGSYLPMIGISLANYFKIRLRSDPLLGADLRLAAEAGGIVGGYTLDLTWLVWFALLCLVAGLLFSIFLMPQGLRGWQGRGFGALSCAALLCVSFVSVFTSPAVYQKTNNNRFINQWSDVEIFVSKGCVYPFLYSFRDMFPTPPPGYDKLRAQQLLSQYPDAAIPAHKQVSVMGIMLEAFCDLTDYPVLADQSAVAQVYAPWHALEEQAVSGNLLTNIFAGGTVDSEWGFLTGYSQHDEFRTDTDSYVWYLKNRGYQTFGSHPGFGWFYNRQNVNQYLGFDDYWFTENHYGDLVDPIDAIYNSDHLLAQELFDQLRQGIAQGPCFSFSVAYQNHGPYEPATTTGQPYLTSAATGLSDETCNIWNNYLKGVSDTIDAMVALTAQLEQLDKPVVLVLFGDHKPWGGNGNSAYTEIGVTFDLSSLAGFYDYYSTPYLIWGNSAAKAVLDNQLVGQGGDFSPCFLMEEVFTQCGWEGPGFMQLSRQVRAVTPLVHTVGLTLENGQLTDQPVAQTQTLLEDYYAVQYYRENEVMSLAHP